MSKRLFFVGLAISACAKPLTGNMPILTTTTETQKVSSSDPQNTLASIGDSLISVHSLQEKINTQSPFVRARFSEAQELEKFLESQIRFEVLAQEAFRRGIHEAQEVQDAIKKIVVQKITREVFDNQVKLADVTTGEIEEYYKSHKEEYNKEEMIGLRYISIPFGEDKAPALAKANAVRAEAANESRLADREHFRKLVEKYSEEGANKRGGGDLRYLTAEDLTTRFGEKAQQSVWALGPVNEVTEVVEGLKGFYVFKKTGHRKAIRREIEQVRNQVRNRVYRDKRKAAFDKFIEDLKGKMKVKTYFERLSKVRVDTNVSQANPHSNHKKH